MPVNAADFAYSIDSQCDSIEEIVQQSTDGEDFSNETSVYAVIGSTYKVTIPKVIVLSGVTKLANFYIEVKGDITDNEILHIEPDEAADLYSNNKPIQMGAVSQDITAL